MAIPILSILRAVAPLAGKATEILATYATLQRQGSSLALEEQVRRLETESMRAGEVLRSTTEQLLLLAEQVRVQQRRCWWVLGLSIVALLLSVFSLAAAQ